MFSLAAAARGLRVVAFEGSTKSAEGLRNSIRMNGFEGLAFNNITLGHAAGDVMAEALPTGVLGCCDAARLCIGQASC